ncbi:nitroreductase family protein [Methanocella conradii]|uniref:nitroreductase family protein n=1 Tax=Methanocella conradii TaxID=1175444 RepID=UPI00157D4CB8|nr:nitroreductase family protein [Methanocella conradii]
MNDVFKNIYLRRAVRDYRPDDVPDDIIRELIKAGTYAPSAVNRQPWRFVVIKDRDMIARLSDRAKKLWLDTARLDDPEAARLATAMRMPGFNIFYNAPVLILIFAAPGAMYPECECALAAENMMLAARSLGIGSCWIGLAMPLGSDKSTLDELKVPEGHRLIAPLIFGYLVKDAQTAPPRNEDVILNWIQKSST